MRPQTPQRARYRRSDEGTDSEPDSDSTMIGTSALSSRKKPVCQKCGMPMAGHKRPQGSPVCPRGPASPSPARSSCSPEASTPSRASHEPPSLLSRISPEHVRYRSSSSGYYRRQNPNWVEPEHYARMPSHAPIQVPRRGETVASWQSTELDVQSDATPPSGEPVYHEIDDDEEEYDTEGLNATEFPKVFPSVSPSPAPSDSFTRFGRHLSGIFGRSTPVAAVYDAHSGDVMAIEHAAQTEGLATAAVHRPRRAVKAEPTTPGEASGSRTTLGRESSWLVFVGRDGSAVDALAQSQTPVVRLSPTPEPYDYDKGLNRERNERVGAYPVDPRRIHPTFCDMIFLCVFSSFAAVFWLSCGFF
ncbi:hypothetical protein C8Q77DRAFT_1154126 [Trametes polyzona]|nr:hypothetical protein C8Q77DRAFT_1154126 [Trametes polyzona]